MARVTDVDCYANDLAHLEAMIHQQNSNCIVSLFYSSGCYPTNLAIATRPLPGAILLFK